MKRSRFSEEQIIGILREAESGSPIKAVCATHNISTATSHGWKRKFGGMEVSHWGQGANSLTSFLTNIPASVRGSLFIRLFHSHLLKVRLSSAALGQLSLAAK